MSTFLQSPGKQFVRSPGRQRDAGGVGGMVEYSRNINFMERDPGGVRFHLFLPNLFESHIFPPDPEVTPAELAASPTGAFVFNRWYREQDAPVFKFGIGYDGTYQRYYGDNADSFVGGQPVTPIHPATRDPFFWMTVRNTYFPPYSNFHPHVTDISFLFAPGNTFPADRKGLQSSCANGHVASYEWYPEVPTFETPTSVLRPEAFSGQRARFRVMFNSPAWIGRMTRTVNVTYDSVGTAVFAYQFTDFRFIRHESVAAGAWNEVPHPLSLVGGGDAEASVRNHYYFWLYAETPEEWQTRTGIPLAGL